MKKLATLLLAGLFSLALFSQNDPRIARTKTPLAAVPLALMPHLDNGALLAVEMERRAPGIAPRFAETIEVNISPTNNGHWEQLANGNALWRQRIRSAGAKSINLGFTKYLMPTGGSLILYSPDFQTVLGPFTPADNEEHEQLWTPVLPSDELIMEVQLPAHSQAELQLELKYVNHDFVGFAEMLSGSCNLDVICGAADGFSIVDNYRDIIQSVAVISTGGGTFCTGFLVNNARQDCKPYFMTAFHCGITAGEAPSLVTYWNFQNSTCRQPGSPASGQSGDGQLNDFNTGSTFRAGGSATDFTLVELDDPVSETANAFFAGWNATGIPQDTSICVHHPSTDEKRITFDFNTAEAGTWSGTAQNHWNVVWDLGVTEPGSSGSPLFDQDHRVVGQLHGGPSSCTSADKSDLYGMFHLSWTGSGTPASSLKGWLDPDDTGVLTLDGRAALQCSFFVEGSPASQSFCNPTSVVYDITVSQNFTAPVTLSIANLPAGLTATFGTNPVAPGGTTTVSFGNTNSLAEGSYTFILDGTDGVETSSSNLQLNVASQTPAPPTTIFPVNGEAGIGLTPIFTWTATPGYDYTIEVASDAAFTNIIETATNLTTGSYTATTPLTSLTSYFWRVRGENICGQGAWPATANSFTTGAVSCAPAISTNVPVAISQQGNIFITSTLQVANAGFVDDVNVINLNIQHSWVGDMRAELISPSGTTVSLFDNPGGGDCSEDNVLLTLDDEATATNAALDQMCSGTSPAIQGTFQPLNALSTFNGEPASGTWTLKIYDDAAQDGGSLISWGLDMCSTIPNSFSVTASNNSLTSCVGSDLGFDLSLGTAFDDASGVTLSATNLPAGTTAIFTPNPAQPGTQVAVTVSGAASSGSFPFQVVGTDGLGNTGSANLQWSVQGAPAVPTAIFPAQNATGVTINPMFSWSATGNLYNLTVAEEPDMTGVIVNGVTTQQPSQMVATLEPCATYYWTVAASNNCGVSGNSQVFNFTTLDDLSFVASPGIVQVCPTDNDNITLDLGECFEANGVTLAASGLPAGASVSFLQNPVPAGSSQTVGISLFNVASGAYNVILTGNDGTNSVAESFTLNVSSVAAAPVFVAPANTAIEVNPLTSFDWNTVAGASNYNFELATDANFTNTIVDVTVAQTNYTVSSPLNLNTTYYWRVTAFNNCGGTTPAPYSFTTQVMNNVNELNGISVSVLPNPTSGELNIRFSKPTYERMEATLFGVNGVLLKNQVLQIGSSIANFDLSELPSGVYLLRLKGNSAVLTEKVIVEK